MAVFGRTFPIPARGALNRFPPEVQQEIFKAAALRIDLESEQKSRLEPYYYNFAAFLLECVEWPEGRTPTEYQLEIAREMYGTAEKPLHDSRIAEYGPHGIGKTALVALMVLHFALVSEAMSVDWKVITTAGSNTQLKRFLWPEIHKWVPQLRWEKIGRESFNQFELQDMALKLMHGQAFAVNSANHALIEGAHAKRLLYIFDEAKAIPSATFDAIEGAFANVGTFGYEAYAFAPSTPGDEAGRFYEICKRQPGYDDWKVIHVTSKQAQKAGMQSKKWLEQRRRQWGEDSQLFINRVLGEFSSKNTNGVIPLSWVEKAVERWREWTDNGKKKPDEVEGMLDRIGVDVAWEGDDKSAIALAYTSKRIYRVISIEKADPMEIAGRTHSIKQRWGGTPVIDVVGIGAGVYARLAEIGDSPEKFNAAEGSSMRDKLDEFGMLNKRAAAWWQLRERLDPESGYEICLPDDPILLGDLTAPKYKVTSGSNIQIESKQDIKKRGKRKRSGVTDGEGIGIGRSTDKGDAVVMALFDDESPVKQMQAW